MNRERALRVDSVAPGGCGVARVHGEVAPDGDHHPMTLLCKTCFPSVFVAMCQIEIFTPLSVNVDERRRFQKLVNRACHEME